MSDDLPIMYGGKARGGPLDNIRIDAPITWDGFVRRQHPHDSQARSVEHHEGKYIWDWFGEAGHRWKTWVWHEGYAKPKFYPAHKTKFERELIERRRTTRQVLAEWMEQQKL